MDAVFFLDEWDSFIHSLVLQWGAQTLQLLALDASRGQLYKHHRLTAHQYEQPPQSASYASPHRCLYEKIRSPINDYLWAEQVEDEAFIGAKAANFLSIRFNWLFYSCSFYVPVSLEIKNDL